MKIQNKDNKGNPYHSDANGQFTSKDGGGAVNNDSKELGEAGFTGKDLLSPDFKPKMSDEEYLSWLDELDLYEDEVEEQSGENKLKPVEFMSQEEIILEIGNRIQSLKGKNMYIDGYFFENDLVLKLGCLRQLDAVTEKYGIKFDKGFAIKTINDPDEATAFVNTQLSAGGNRRGTFLQLSSEEIVFNTSDMVNTRNTKQMINLQQRLGGWVETSEDFYPEVVACHECGHIVFNSIFTQMSKNKEFDLNYYLLMYKNGMYGDPNDTDETKISPLQLMIGDITKNEIIERVYEIYKTDNPGLGREEFSMDTSAYGKSSPAEWFAETFASMNGGKPSKSALALQKWLNGFYNFNGGNK